MDEYVHLVLLRCGQRLIPAEAPQRASGLARGSLAAFTEDGVLEEVGLVTEVDFIARDDEALKILRTLHPEMALVTRVWAESWRSDEKEMTKEC